MTTDQLARESAPPTGRTRRAVGLGPGAAFLATILTAGALAACHPRQATIRNPAPTPIAVARYRPAHDLGPLFAAVQLSGLFSDSKTFVDAQLRRPAKVVVRRYTARSRRPQFNLRAFVHQNFVLPPPTVDTFSTNPSQTMEQHIRALWPVLTRGPPAHPDRLIDRSSLIPLPAPYVVPGGRFREVYYWDSYFTMLGLVRSGRLDLVKDMLDDFAYLIRTFGHVPNGNRTYYLSRSQPPFFAAMVGLYAQATDTARVLPYLDALVREHAFWMDGANKVGAGQAWHRVVRLPDGGLLNRYWDDLAEPRPESYREDYTAAQRLPTTERHAFYRNVRATAESGWDFSSRWMRDPGDLTTLETTALAPIDLNSLLYYDERLIAALYAFRGRPGDMQLAQRFAAGAAARRQALRHAFFDPDSGYFYDVRWRNGHRVVDRPTLAAVYPLYFGVASPQQARAVGRRLAREFLEPGGFVTTLIHSGQQWDAPNGWPPLQWLAIQGLRRNGLPALADTARARWLALNRRVFRATGRMEEKYDVENMGRPAGGGEYPTQDGFGWTNGVALALSGQR